MPVNCVSIVISVNPVNTADFVAGIYCSSEVENNYEISLVPLVSLFSLISLLSFRFSTSERLIFSSSQHHIFIGF
jgi:hypothetical protein